MLRKPRLRDDTLAFSWHFDVGNVESERIAGRSSNRKWDSSRLSKVSLLNRRSYRNSAEFGSRVHHRRTRGESGWVLDLIFYISSGEKFRLFKSIRLCFLVPLWSGVNVAGVQFRDILPNIGLETDEERWYEISKEVVRLWASSSTTFHRNYVMMNSRKKCWLINNFFQWSHGEMPKGIQQHGGRPFGWRHRGGDPQQLAKGYTGFNIGSSTGIITSFLSLDRSQELM